MEGFTEYYSGATLFREGLLDGAGFAEFLNGLILEYAENREVLRTTLDQLSSQHWRDRDHQRIPYVRGALLGLLMDLQLRKKGKSLDDYMRAMLPQRNYGLAELRRTWVSLAGKEGAAFWDRYIPTAEALPFASVLRSAGVAFDERPTPIFELGFATDKLGIEKNARVMSVEPGSNAEKAGIRVGDSLQGFSVNHGDTTKQAKFNVLRGEERVSVSYLPVTSRTVVQVSDSLALLR
jgi:predicted metalloprotease with PDZ domain